jgi:hypothetical protein
MDKLEVEEWRLVKGFEKHYEVSSFGNIRRLGKKVNRKFSKSGPYLHILLSVEGKHKTLRIHRIIAIAFCKRSPLHVAVNHKNGFTTCNRASNLEWTTQVENNEHSYKILGNVSPMLSKKNVFTENPKVNNTEQIARMVTLHGQGVITDIIGEMMGIAGSTVRKYIRRYNTSMAS